MDQIIREREGKFKRLQTVFKVFGNILDSIREPLVFLDPRLHVVKANRSFYQIFAVKPEETEGMLIFDLGNRQWNIPKLRELLEEILPQNSVFDDLEVEHTFETIGRKVMRLNARRIHQKTGQAELILLAIEDVTEREDQKRDLEELVARAIHGMSLRSSRPLVKVNCAALPANLIESELFSHEKGAFTGALSRHFGRFEIADKATLFLDEIGELPFDLQAKLLRVVQDGEFERLGGSRTMKVDVRIIAATNRDLEEEVRKGGFREDLWYRLNIFPITVPPLRDRLDDIPLLVEFYVAKIAKRMGKTITHISSSISRNPDYFTD